MSIKNSLYSRKGITTLSVIMAVLVIGSGVMASKKGIFADTNASSQLTISAWKANGTNKMVFRAVSSVDVKYFDFWWNCSAVAADVTEQQLMDRCGQPQVTTVSQTTGQSTSTGDLTKGVRPATYSRQAVYQKTLPATITNGKFVVFAKGTTSNYTKTFTYSSGIVSLARYGTSPWHVSAKNILTYGTRFVVEKLDDNDGNVPLRRFSVWYNCDTAALTADKDTLVEVKVVCGNNPDVTHTQYADRYVFNHLFASSNASKMVAFVAERYPSTYYQRWDETKAKLVAQVDYTPANLTPTPTPTPRPSRTVSAGVSATRSTVPVVNLKANLTTDIMDNGLGVKFTANLTNQDGTAPAPASADFSVWWNCSSPSTVYADIVTACGRPRLGAASYDELARSIGRRNERVNANSISWNNTFGNAINGNVAKVLIERSGKNYTKILPYNYSDPVITPSIEISPTPQVAGQLITVKAKVTDAAKGYNTTNYNFWWNCDEQTTSVEDATRLCGQPRAWGQTYTQAQWNTGLKFTNIRGGTAPNWTTVNEEIARKTFPEGPRTIKIIVERRSQSVETRVHITVNPGSSSTPTVSRTVTASSTPTSTALATTITRNFTPGYNVFGSTSKLLPSAIARNALLSPIWGINTPEKPSANLLYSAIWNNYPQDNLVFKMNPGNAYYVYNQGTAREVTITAVPSDENNRELRPGWNMIWRQSAGSLYDMRGTLFSSTSQLFTPLETNKCIKRSISLQELVDKGIAYNQVYIIQQPNADASSSLARECQSYRLLGSQARTPDNCTVDRTNNTISNMGVVTQIPADKGIWFYIYPQRMDRADQLTTGSACPVPNVQG